MISNWTLLRFPDIFSIPRHVTIPRHFRLVGNFWGQQNRFCFPSITGKQIGTWFTATQQNFPRRWPERPSLVKDSAHQRPSLVKDSAGSWSVHPWSRIVLWVGSLPSCAVPYPTIIFTCSVDGDWDRNDSAGQCVVFLEPERPSLVKDSAHQCPSLVKDSAGSWSVHPWSRIVLRVGSLPSRADTVLFHIRQIDGYYQPKVIGRYVLQSFLNPELSSAIFLDCFTTLWHDNFLLLPDPVDLTTERKSKPERINPSFTLSLLRSLDLSLLGLVSQYSYTTSWFVVVGTRFIS